MDEASRTSIRSIPSPSLPPHRADTFSNTCCVPSHLLFVAQRVLDITEYAKCNGMLHDARGDSMEANTCFVPFRFGVVGEEKGGGWSSSAAGGGGARGGKKKGRRR